MNRNELQQLSKIRLKESSILLNAGFYGGAYYLAGYSIECALKACIAKQTKRCEFPNKDLANKAWVHDLEQLIRTADLSMDLYKEMKINKALEINWAVVKDWNESTRYDLSISSSQAINFSSACFARKDGILSWIKKRW